MSPASIESAYGDYNELAQSLLNGNISKDTVYEQIMAKEENRIELINRVVEQSSEKKWSDTMFYNKSIMEVIIMFASTWKTMFGELFVERRFDIDSLQHTLYDGDRKIYTGIMMVFIALFLFFVNASV
jgi:hypothetical protein